MTVKLVVLYTQPADRAAFDAALGSPEGAAAGQDYGQVAPPGSRMLIEVVED